MKILHAEHSGFCFGVKRAVALAEEQAETGPLYTLGPLIHNPREIERLAGLGIHSRLADQITEGQRVLIRTHGVGPQVYQGLREKSCMVIEATCPYVRKAQSLAAEAARAGYQVILLGDREHPEIQGIRSWAGENTLVVKSWQELTGLELPERLAVLAQTTEKEENFRGLVNYLESLGKELKVMNTICGAAKERQQAVVDLAKKVDLILIIGGKNSSNTRKLWEICQENNIPSYLVEGSEDLNREWFKGINSVGISAGASTPMWIVEEVNKRMEEFKEQEVTVEAAENRENLAASEAAESAENPAVPEAVEDMEQQAAADEQMPNMNDEAYYRSFQPGDLVKGKVVKVTGDEVLVEIGGKSEGIVPSSELAYRKVDPRETVSVGDELLVQVLKEDKEGNIILSRKRAVVDEALDKLEKSREEGSIISARVTEVVKGGLVVDVGLRGFIPASQVERSFVEDLNQYLHKDMRLKVLELDRSAKKVVLSQRAVLDEEYQKQKQAVWAELAEGQIRQGTVKRLAPFGAFIDLGGVDGLLHVSELSWTHVKDPSEIVKPGDQLEVFVLKVDREKEKVSLSLKQLLKSPWELAQEKYQMGMIVEGKVMRLVPFGAFIELEPGVEGLAHISQLAAKRVNKAEDVLSVGQMVKAKILEFDPEKKRISLSLKEVEADAEKAEYQAFIDQQPEQEETVTIGEVLQENKE